MATQHNEIVRWLEQYLSEKSNNWGIAKNFEETPDISSKLKSKDDRFFIDRYAIDIICYKEILELKEGDSSETDHKIWNYVFYIVSVNKFWNDKYEIDENLRNKLLFYQFYFSQKVVTEPKAIKITIAIPSSLEISQRIKTSNESDIDFFDEYGFGLWKVDIKLDKPEILHDSYSLRDRMIRDFGKSIDDNERLKPKIEEIEKDISTNNKSLKELIKLNAEAFALFFDQYVLDAIDSIAGINREQIGKRYIDRRLLDLACICIHSESIPYYNELRLLINEHLDKKEDEYDFTKKCFGELWGLLWKNVNPVTKIKEYPLILKEFEPILKQFSKRYREHFVHQMQVYLLGIIIVDKVYQNCFSDVNPEEFDKIMQNWLLTSSIHDITYPLQEYDKWSSDFFEKQLSINEPLSFFELSSIYIEKRFANRVEFILSQLKDSWVLPPSQENRIYNAIRNFIYYEIANKKNHGLMSSSYLLKTLENEDQITINRFLPAATAMALHDDEIWLLLSGQLKEKQSYIINNILDPKEKGLITDIIKNHSISDSEKDDKIYKRLYEKEGSWTGTLFKELIDISSLIPLPHLCFEKHPVEFLLILCDNLQDCGRPCLNDRFNQMMQLTNISLKEIDFQQERKELKIRMSFFNSPDCSDFISKKKDSLEKIGNFLHSEKIKFIIEFWDINNNNSPWFQVKIE